MALRRWRHFSVLEAAIGENMFQNYNERQRKHPLVILCLQCVNCQSVFVYSAMPGPKLSTVVRFDVIMWFSFTYATFGIIT